MPEGLSPGYEAGEVANQRETVPVERARRASDSIASGLFQHVSSLFVPLR